MCLSRHLTLSRAEIVFTGQLSAVLGPLKWHCVHRGLMAHSLGRLSKATEKAFPSLSGEVTYSVWESNITLFMGGVK